MGASATGQRTLPVTSYFLILPIGLYAIGWLVEFVRFWRTDHGPLVWSGGMLAVGWGAHTFLLAYDLWTGEIGVGTVLSIVAWAAMIANYGVHLRWRHGVFGFIFPPFAIAMLLSAALLSEAVVQVESFSVHPAVWRAGLIVHIVSILAGNLLFAMACVFSIVFLYQEHRIKAKVIGVVMTRLPSLSALDRLNHRAIALGFFFLSAGILLGIGLSGGAGLPERLLSIRQLVPMATWLVYAAFLLQWTFQGQRGRLTAIWSIAGFAVVVTSMFIEIALLTARA